MADLMSQLPVAFSAFSLLIAFLSLLIALLAFFNARRARLDAKGHATHQLKMDALLAAKASEGEWQQILNDLDRMRHRLRLAAKQDASLADLIKWCDDFEEFGRSALENAAKLARTTYDSFDQLSDQEARSVLKTCAVGKLSLASNREEMQRRFATLEEGISKSR